MVTAEGFFAYDEAKRRGDRERGFLGLRGSRLPSLDDIDTAGASEEELGLVELPMKKIAGTSSRLRAKSFTAGFMPAMGKKTEFASKWAALCAAHIRDGIRDPIAAIEYLNRFYVVEGNKRVSVLKYFDALSVPGYVKRLVPRRTGDPEIERYYEFMEFYRRTRINGIWFTRPGGFARLEAFLDTYAPAGAAGASAYEHFYRHVYTPFRIAVYATGVDALGLTTGEAFLEYLKLYGAELSDDRSLIQARLKAMLGELEGLSAGAQILGGPELEPEGRRRLMPTLGSLIRPDRKLRIAFAYYGTIKDNGWTQAHEEGRRHLQGAFGKSVETSFVENVPAVQADLDLVRELAMLGNDILFVTNPLLLDSALKTALEFPEVKVFACCEAHSFKQLSTYYGRIYEPRFLAGVIAGSISSTETIGYVASYPLPGVIVGINAFALGVRMARPRSTVRVEWAYGWDTPSASEELSARLAADGARLIFHQNSLTGQGYKGEYGLYSMAWDEGRKRFLPRDYIAAPVWNWGIFYQKLLAEILVSGGRVANRWWGMSSGAVDIRYSKLHVPLETHKLVTLLKRLINEASFNPFDGPLVDNQGSERIRPGERPSFQSLMAMDYFVEGITGDIVDAKARLPQTGPMPGTFEPG